MPEFGEFFKRQKAIVAPAADMQPSTPTPALDQPAIQVVEIGIIKPLFDELALLNKHVDLLVKDLLKSRTLVDQNVQMSDSIGYLVNYQERKFVFLSSTTAFTLALSNGATYPVEANVWFNASFPRGTILTADGQSDAAPLMVLIRCTDEPMISTPNPVSQIVNGLPISATNPEINIANFQAMILLGQGFNASTGKVVAAADMAGQVFFPSTNPKNILIESIRLTYTNANQAAQLQYITAADANISGAGSANMTIENLLLGGAASAAGATANYNGGIVAAEGSPLDLVNIQNSNTIEALSEGLMLFLPKLTAGGIAVYVPTTAAGSWAMTVRWSEF